jgi:ATP-dependent helicase HrpA
MMGEVADDVEQSGLTAWNPGTLARVVERRRAGYQIKAYPALVDEADSVAVRVFETEEQQARAMWAGTRRLLLLSVPSPVPLLGRRLPNAVKLGLTRYPYQTVPDLLDDCVACAVDAIVERAGGPVWSEDEFDRLRDEVRSQLTDTTVDVVIQTERIIAAAHEVRDQLSRPAPAQLTRSVDDMRTQLVELTRPGFVTSAGLRRLPHVARYVRAIQRRLEKLPTHGQRDLDWLDQVEAVREEYEDLRGSVPPDRRDSEEITQIRWMIEELRVSYFAQDLRTPYPISDVRLYRLMDQLR